MFVSIFLACIGFSLQFYEGKLRECAPELSRPPSTLSRAEVRNLLQELQIFFGEEVNGNHPPVNRPHSYKAETQCFGDCIGSIAVDFDLESKIQAGSSIEIKISL
jgi:hypothetical protein